MKTLRDALLLLTLASCACVAASADQSVWMFERSAFDPTNSLLGPYLVDRPPTPLIVPQGKKYTAKLDEEFRKFIKESAQITGLSTAVMQPLLVCELIDCVRLFVQKAQEPNPADLIEMNTTHSGENSACFYEDWINESMDLDAIYECIGAYQEFSHQNQHT